MFRQNNGASFLLRPRSDKKLIGRGPLASQESCLEVRAAKFICWAALFAAVAFVVALGANLAASSARANKLAHLHARHCSLK